MTAEDFTALLRDVKLYTDITWDDEQTDQKLAGIVKRGMAYLSRRAGETELDFLTEGQPRALLMDYARYARANALDDFPLNYRQELLDLYLMHHARRLQDAENETAE